VRKFRPDGKTSWTRQFGTSSHDSPKAVATDSAGRVYVVGNTSGTFPGQTNKGSNDAFVRKFRSDDKTSWTRQFGTGHSDFGLGIAIDKGGRIYVTGQTYGAFPGKTNNGTSEDGFLRKYRPDGKASWTRQFGSSKGDGPYGIATDNAGRIIITGHTYGTFPGQSNKGDSDIFVRKYR